MEVPLSVEITDGQRLETEQLQDESSMDGVQQSGGQETGEQQTGEQQIGEQQTGEQQIGEQQTGEPQTGEQEMWGLRDGGRVLVSGTTTAPLRRSTRITRGVPPVRYAWAVVVEPAGLDDEEEDDEWTNLDPDANATKTLPSCWRNIIPIAETLSLSLRSLIYSFIAAGGSAGVDAASWGRKLLEASGGDLDVGGEEEEAGEATDGLDEAVRVLLTWKQIKNAANQAAKSEAGQKAGGLVKNVVKKGGKEALTAAVNAFRSGKGAKGALQAGAGLFYMPSTYSCTLSSLPSPTDPGVTIGILQSNPPLVSHWSGGVNLWKPPSPLCTLACFLASLPFPAAPASGDRVPAGNHSEPLELERNPLISSTALAPFPHSRCLPVMVGFLQGSPVSHWEWGSQPVTYALIALHTFSPFFPLPHSRCFETLLQNRLPGEWKPAAVKPGNILDYTSPPPDYTSPPPDYSSPSPDYTSPPPDYTSPPPDYTSPPPDYTSPPPDYTSPPPDYTSPPPDYTFPAPDYTSPPPETHDVQRFKNTFAFKACAFFNAVPLTSTSQFGMRLFQVKPAHAGKMLFFGSSVGKD
ncbi:unnamed protein product [Closterium sp. NIES-65]|nr:unnamed protein product [Closterium sp. NIES-65]